MRWRVPHAILPGLLFVAVMAAVQPAAPANARSPDSLKKVLVLYSTRRDAEFSRLGQSNLPRLLDAGLNSKLDYYSEFIDRTRLFDPAYQGAFRDFLKVKYHGVRFDLVIAMQNVAADFVDQNRTGLFSGTPILVLTNAPGWKRFAHATGVINPRNFTGTVAFMRRMQPDIENVFVVTGAGPADREYDDAFRKELQSSRSPPKIIYLSGLATSDLDKRLSQLPPRSAIYYLLMSRDRLGGNYHPLNYLDRISAVANAPIYSWVDSAMGHGILGGDLYVQSSVIEQMSKLALRVLGGQKPRDIPVSVFDAHITQVDWRQLRRWGIDESRIPAGTLVKFRNPTVWDQYGNYIMTG